MPYIIALAIPIEGSSRLGFYRAETEGPYSVTTIRSRATAFDTIEQAQSVLDSLRPKVDGVVTPYTSKATILLREYGFTSMEDMIASAVMDSVCPGICTNLNCDYTTDVEPDCRSGYCELCDTHTVKSILVLKGMI